MWTSETFTVHFRTFVLRLAKLKSCARHQRLEMEEKERQREDAVEQRNQMLKV